MSRVFHSVLLAALAATTIAAGAAAQQVSNTNRQATLVMRNGDHHSGTLVYHNNNNLNLIENGQDRAYPIDDIVLVDFAGGDPNASELGRLPTTINGRDVNHHMLALRDGSVVHGRMYTITPTAITFNTRGGHQDFDLNNVARWYVSPPAARQMYANILGTQPPAPVATSGQSVPAGAITVSANQPWTDTGITVRKGARLAFSTTGQVAIRQGATEQLGPDGSPTEARAGAPSQAIGVGGLIGRVGTGAPFPIGSNSQPIAMPASGRLYLGVNDAGVSDNSGAFIVTIVR